MKNYSEIEVLSKKNIKVAACIECKSTNIKIYDYNYSSFNKARGECLDCESGISFDCGTFPTKEELVEVWNSYNDPSMVIETLQKEQQEIKGRSKEITAEIRRLKKLL